MNIISTFCVSTPKRKILIMTLKLPLHIEKRYMLAARTIVLN